MIYRLVIACAAMFFGLLLACLGAEPVTLKLEGGETVSGELITADAQGVMLKMSDGQYKRTPWSKLSQETLKPFNDNPRTKKFVEPFVIAEDDTPEKKAKAEITFTAPPRMERPDPKAGFGSITAAPLMITIFVLLYLANIYAGYEAALFRNYPPLLVAGVAAVAPIVGPILFICLPPRLNKEAVAALEAVEPEAPQFFVGQPDQPGGAPPPPPPPGKGQAAAVYQRGQTTFNRRFFETKFAGFLRMVPAEPERDQVIYVKSARGEHIASRISRLMPNELYLQVVKGGASSDVMIPFTEIVEVQVRIKEA